VNLLRSSVHFGREPNRKRVCGSLNRTRQNHYGSEPNQTKPNRERSKSRLKSWLVVCMWGHHWLTSRCNGANKAHVIMFHGD